MVMRLAKASTKLDYARPGPRVRPQSLSGWGWLAVFGGFFGGVLGFLLAMQLDSGPTMEVHWLVGVLVALLMFGGAALCVTGIVLVAIAASRPG